MGSLDTEDGKYFQIYFLVVNLCRDIGTLNFSRSQYFDFEISFDFTG